MSISFHRVVAWVTCQLGYGIVLSYLFQGGAVGVRTQSKVNGPCFLARSEAVPSDDNPHAAHLPRARPM
jgi:hypothetical protein